jgi:NitT/TauT family transport system ATP-binding protein
VVAAALKDHMANIDDAGVARVAKKTVAVGEIRVENVSKSYGSGPFTKTVVKDCSFTIERNKLTVMIGPSGCGKSTLIRLLAGFEKPSSGSIHIDGKPINGPGKDRLVVFQESALFPWMTTYDNIMYGPRARGEDTSDSRKQAAFLLDKVGLKAFAKKYPPQLSGGMQRRAELARAMINNPDVMILDEPFRGLDAMSKELMWEYYAGLFEESHRTNFFVTTDIDEAIFLADRLIVMTNIPTQVRATIEVNIPRPRQLVNVFDNDHANQVKMQALSLLHEEAMKSFSGGSRAAADFVEAYSKRTPSGHTAPAPLIDTPTKTKQET